MSDLTVDDLDNIAFDTRIPEEIEPLDPDQEAYFDTTDCHAVKAAVVEEMEAALQGRADHRIDAQAGTTERFVVELSDVESLFKHINFDHQTGGDGNRRALQKFNNHFRVRLVESE